MKKPILFLCPMECELTVIASALENVKKEKPGCFEAFCGTLCGYPAVAVKTFIGTVNCAAATALCIEKYNPLCVILQGTAGAHDKSLHRNDIVIAEKIVPIASYFAKSRKKGEGINKDDWEFFGSQILENGAIKGSTELCCDENLIKIAQDIPYEGGKKVTGTVGSADVWNRELDLIEYLNCRFGTLCEEMEGYAAAQICSQYAVPFADIRVISNSEWYANEPFSEESAEKCQNFCLSFAKKIIK